MIPILLMVGGGVAAVRIASPLWRAVIGLSLLITGLVIWTVQARLVSK